MVATISMCGEILWCSESRHSKNCPCGGFFVGLGFLCELVLNDDLLLRELRPLGPGATFVCVSREYSRGRDDKYGGMAFCGWWVVVGVQCCTVCCGGLRSEEHT